MDINNEFHIRTNRQDAMKPKAHSKHWCESCDRDLVHVGVKCKTCGVLSDRKVLRKDMV